MLHRARRPLAILAPLLLVSATVAACGSDGDGAPASSKGLDAVSISGDVGATPELDWKTMMTAGDPDLQTVEEGDGDALKKGDQVLVNYVVGNGYTEKTAVDTFGAETPGFVLTVGTPTVPATQDPNAVTVADLAALFVSTEIKAGVTRGSRLAITVNSANMFGQYLTLPSVAKADIGNMDGILVVADVLDEPILTTPDGAQQQPDPDMPRPIFEKGVPTGFNFNGIAEPDDKLHATVLKKGDGPKVEKGDIMVADYLGEVYDGEEPFDASYGKMPLTTAIGLGSVIKGWDKALVGQTVGSRVVLQIPPDLGYGDAGQGETIPPKSTLYFVIDILGAA